MSFLPICNVCILEIASGTQGMLLSCGHFVCRDCCGAFEPSVCPHCGSRGRAAPLDHPPAEVRDYLQNPLTQFRASSDVAMFQIDHFRSVAKQASKALHELRLRYSREVKRREEAEKEVEELRARAARTADFRGDGREGSNGDRPGSFVPAFGEGRARSERSNNSGVDSNSPIGKLRQRFLGIRSEESGEKMPVPGTPQGERHGRAREDVHDHARQSQAMREVGGAVGTALRESGSDSRPSMSFARPSSSLSQTVGQGIGGKPNTPRTPSGPPLIERRIVPGEQQPRQQVPTVSQRPETPGRPIRPAWQDTGRVRLGGERGGGGSQQLIRPSTPRHPQIISPQARQQQSQPGRPQARTDMKDLRRPTSGQEAANGGGGRTGQFPAVAPYDNRPSTGATRPTSSPASPLVGVGGSLKRPSSGSLPSPKRPGSSSAADRGRTGTPLPLTPLRTCPPSPRLRSPQLPFTPRSTPRPASVQRPQSTGGGKGMGRFDAPNGRTPSTPSSNPQRTNLQQSLAAAGLFPPQGPR